MGEGGVQPTHSLEGCLVLPPSFHQKLKESLAIRCSETDAPAKLDTRRILSLVYGYAWQVRNGCDVWHG